MAAAAADQSSAGQSGASRADQILQAQAVRGVLAIAGISLFCNLCIVLVPLFNMQIFTRVMPTRDLPTLWSLCLGLVIILLFWMALDQLRAAALRALGDRVARALAPPLLAAAGAEETPGGERPAVAQALQDIESLRQFLGSATAVAPFDLAWTPVLILVLMAQHWAYGLLAIACVLILGLLNLAGDALSRRQVSAAHTAQMATVQELAGALRSAGAVRAMGMLAPLMRRHDEESARASNALWHALRRARAIGTATRTLRMAMTATMVAMGLVLALNDLASSGSMVAGNMILARILLPIERLANTRQQWGVAIACWQRVRAALQASVTPRYAMALPRPSGRLEVDRLVYLPPGGERPLLRGLSFDLLPGEGLGLIGPSGGGKSTLLRLILGMVAPTTGGVYLDGHSTFLWEREDFARHAGYVPQSVTLTEGTVAENISRLATPDLARVAAAARAAGVHETILRLPYGYATPIAGHVLSAGQRQRVALARALYGDPRLLILDEPSGFLDQAGEASLLALLRDLRAREVGVILVTHRPALIACVDKLMVLRDGLIERFGEREAILRALQAPPVQVLRARAQA
jgi:ATP-binding cassette subfamily C protein